METVTLTLRGAQIERARALITTLENSGWIPSLDRIELEHVLRLALDGGLELLERETSRPRAA